MDNFSPGPSETEINSLYFIQTQLGQSSSVLPHGQRNNRRRWFPGKLHYLSLIGLSGLLLFYSFGSVSGSTGIPIVGVLAVFGFLVGLIGVIAEFF
jgi:hypothetical protein